MKSILIVLLGVFSISAWADVGTYKGTGSHLLPDGSEQTYKIAIEVTKPKEAYQITIKAEWKSDDGELETKAMSLEKVPTSETQFDLLVAGKKTGGGYCKKLKEGFWCNAEFIESNHVIRWSSYYSNETRTLARLGDWTSDGKNLTFFEELKKVR